MRLKKKQNFQNKIGKVIYSTNPKIQNKKEEKSLTDESVDMIHKGRLKVLIDFESKTFPTKKPISLHSS